MATSIGVSDGYYQNVTLNADGSVSFVYVPTAPGGQSSSNIYSAQIFQSIIDSTAALVINNSHPTSGSFNPISALALDVAVQKGIITASQYQSWLAGGDMPVSGIKGFTSYDFNPASSGAIPSVQQVATSTSLMSVNSTDLTTMNAVQQTTAKMTAVSKNLPALTTNQQQIEKMYLAAFLRAPEKSGLDYWVGKLDAGDSLTKVGDIIFSLDIVKAIYSASMGNQQFVTSIYNNVFGKDPDSGGMAYWLGKMDNGEHRGELVMDMINSGLSTAIGTPGRDYIINRFDTVHYAVQNQVKSGVELGVAYLKNLTSQVGADASSIATYQQAIDTNVAAGGSAAQHAAMPVAIVGSPTELAHAFFG